MFKFPETKMYTILSTNIAYCEHIKSTRQSVYSGVYRLLVVMAEVVRPASLSPRGGVSGSKRAPSPTISEEACNDLLSESCVVVGRMVWTLGAATYCARKSSRPDKDDSSRGSDVKNHESTATIKSHIAHEAPI